MQASMTAKTYINSKTTNTNAMAWFVTLTASLIFFYMFIQMNIFNSIDRQLMQAFHLNAPELGQLSSMFFYANAIFIFPAGLLLDRFSTKKIMLFATMMLIIGTFLFGWAETYILAAIGRFITGFGATFCFLSCIRIATRWFPPHKMALVTGVIVTMAMIGGLVAQTPMALLSEWVGWRTSMLLDAGLGIFIFFAIVFFVRDYPHGSQDTIKAQKVHLQNLGFWQSIRLVLLNRQNWFGGLYTSLLNLPVFLLGALWGIHYLVEVHHITAIQGSYATTLFFVGVIFGSPFFGWLSDFMGLRVLPMLVGAVISLAVILVLMYTPNLSFNAILLLFFLIGFVTSSQVLSYPLIAELNPISLTSTAISIVSMTIMISGVICQPLFGWMMQLNWDHTMSNGVPIYSSTDMLNAMLIMPVGFVFGFLISLLMKETFCKAQG